MTKKTYLGLIALITLACIIGGSIWHAHRPVRYHQPETEVDLDDITDMDADDIKEIAGIDADDDAAINGDDGRDAAGNAGDGLTGEGADAGASNTGEVLSGTQENGETLPFTAIDLKMGFSDVIIQAGDGYAVTYWVSDEKYTPSAEISNGVLTVTQQMTRNLDLDSLQKLIGGNGIRGAVTITIPQNVTLDTVRMDIGTGDVKLQGVTADTLEIDNGAGDTELLDISVRKIVLDSGVGDIELERASFDTLSANNGTGDVELEGISNLADYNIELETGVGEISVDGKSRGSDSYRQNGKTGYSIYIETGVGDIEVESTD